MNELFPFDPHQASLDYKAAIALAVAIASKGPSFQILRVEVDERGPFIDLAAHEKAPRAWLEEILRQAQQLVSKEWPEPTGMTGANLREFWRHKGQHLRSQQAIASLLEVIFIEGYFEPLPNGIGAHINERWYRAQPGCKLALVAFDIMHDTIKGHKDKVWRLEARAFSDSQGLRWWNRASKSLSENIPLADGPIKTPELKHYIQTERRWQDCILGLNTQEIYWAEQSRAKINGWYLGVRRQSQRVRLSARVQESVDQGIDFHWQGSEEQLINQFSCVLHVIYEIAKMSSLEVKSTLFTTDQSQANFWLALITGVQSNVNCQVELHVSNEDHFCLWGYDPRGYWWPLSELKLMRDKARASVHGCVVISLQRWSALSQLKR